MADNKKRPQYPKDNDCNRSPDPDAEYSKRFKRDLEQDNDNTNKSPSSEAEYSKKFKRDESAEGKMIAVATENELKEAGRFEQKGPTLHKRSFNRKNNDSNRSPSPEAGCSKKFKKDEPADGNMKVVATHYNELRETGRFERQKSRIFHMRNFNNWIKSQLIHEYITHIKNQQRQGDPFRVLDMCCGKGGDLLKWEKSNITHLICTDIAEVSVQQCKQRYNEMVARIDKTKFAKKFTAEFFACDSTLVRIRERYNDRSLKLNLVSCQFAFHYSFESLSQADCMVRNAAECLQPGGYFIATIPDANEIMRRLRDSPNSRSFGNSLYNIEFVCDTNPPPLFGAKYQFHLEGVVDCPEFLVHFPTLVKLCKKYGLKMERSTTFANYYNENIEKGRNLLQRMNGLESVHISRSKEEQYAHLRPFEKTVEPNKLVGTLSKDEWEATTLYLVCAFKKCKYTWDKNGEPLYEFD